MGLAPGRETRKEPLQAMLAFASGTGIAMSSAFFIMVVTVVAIVGATKVINHIVEAVARTKEARLNLERATASTM